MDLFFCVQDARVFTNKQNAQAPNILKGHSQKNRTKLKDKSQCFISIQLESTVHTRHTRIDIRWRRTYQTQPTHFQKNSFGQFVSECQFVSSVNTPEDFSVAEMCSCFGITLRAVLSISLPPSLLPSLSLSLSLSSSLSRRRTTCRRTRFCPVARRRPCQKSTRSSCNEFRWWIRCQTAPVPTISGPLVNFVQSRLWVKSTPVFGSPCLVRPALWPQGGRVTLRSNRWPRNRE